MSKSSSFKSLCLLLLLTVCFVSLLSSAATKDNGKQAMFEGAPKTADGRFTNTESGLSHGSIAVRLPFFMRRVASSLVGRSGAPERVSNDGQFLRENALHSKPTVTWIGHATMLIQMEHLTFLTDPIWSKRPSPISFLGPNRFVKPGLAIEDLPSIDFVVISHNHYDHLDIPTLRTLAKRDANTKFYVPLGNGPLLRKNGINNVEELDWGQSVSHAGATVHCLPTQHWSKRKLNDTNKALWSAWAVTGQERRFYFAGDTGYFPGFEQVGERLGPFDLAAVPIGAYEPSAMMRDSHMNPEEALQAAIDLKARRAVAMHYGTFNLSDESLTEPPKRFKAAALTAEQNNTFLKDNAWLMQIGETRQF